MTSWKHRSKPVIGLAGGIGSGKSTVARLFAQEGCAVIDSDALAHIALQSAPVKTELTTWLGNTILDPDGRVNRKSVAHAVFHDPVATGRLNAIIHPRVAAERDGQMAVLLQDPSARAIVWDSPLLFESGLNTGCDVIVFVEVSLEVRTQRVALRRGWSVEELAKREKLQFPLDKKAQLADYVIDNSGDEAHSLRQIQQVLSQLFL